MSGMTSSTPEAAGLTRADIVRIELALTRAWPPRETADIEGWIWRSSGGGSRRANSVLPIAFRGASIDRAIEAVERSYRRQHIRSYFQVISQAEPADLDQRLAARGYVYEEPCLLLAKRLGAGAMPSDVAVMPAPSDAWLAIYTATLSPDRRAAAPALLEAVPQRHAFLLAHAEGEPVTTALGVVSPDGIAVVEAVATRADRRRAGSGQRVMDALEAWAAGEGATIAALQVVDGNLPARRLYEQRGYGAVGAYHYRWRDVG
jgi:GNAT superfamily N-acetyltransferase